MFRNQTPAQQDHRIFTPAFWPDRLRLHKQPQAAPSDRSKLQSSQLLREVRPPERDHRLPSHEAWPNSKLRYSHPTSHSVSTSRHRQEPPLGSTPAKRGLHRDYRLVPSHLSHFTGLLKALRMPN